MGSEEHHLTPHWIMRCFGAETARLRIDGKGIYLSRSNAPECTVQLAGLVQNTLVSEGLFFDTFVFKTNLGVIEVSGIGEVTSKRLRKTLFETAYDRIMQPIKNALSTIEPDLCSDHYLRFSTFKGLVMQAQRVIRDVGVISDLSIFEAVDKQRYSRLLDISTWPDEYLLELQQCYIDEMLTKHKEYFDEVESNPLTEKQRIACIVDEHNNLVLAGAGTGKTSVMVGRVGFFLRTEQLASDEVLMLAFAGKAKDEMVERMESRIPNTGVEVRTFHSLGLAIIAQVEGRKPSVSKISTNEVFLKKRVDGWFKACMDDEGYKRQVIKYFKYLLYPSSNPFDFATKSEYLAFLKDNPYITLKGDEVKGYQECIIANFLFSLGVRYEYEAKYGLEPKTIEFKPYQPDFYLPDYGIYIEHYGIDRDGKTAPYIDQQAYLDGIEWKRKTHALHGTTLVETYHYEFLEGNLLQGLHQTLLKNQVAFTKVDDDVLLASIRELGSIDDFSKLLSKLLKRIKGNGYNSSTIDDFINNTDRTEQVKASLSLVKPILAEYERELDEADEVDFDDMIIKAIEHVTSRAFVSGWKQILVDEFQDISGPRARLVKALHSQVEGSSLFCVGDDWQAIYRFSGSDLKFTTEFEQHFGVTKTTTLDKTFRFNSSICDIASRFIQQNSSQVNKTLSPLVVVNTPMVSLMRERKPFLEYGETLDCRLLPVLEAINASVEEGTEVYLLSRFRFHLPSGVELKGIKKRFQKLIIETDTIHGSKGKEADIVVILGLEKGKYGLPSHMVEHPLLDALLPDAGDYKFAEERRLFYVGLTRAKLKVYLICDMTKPSEFVSELMDGNYPIELAEFNASWAQEFSHLLHCIDCSSGVMTTRTGTNGPFCGCSNYPLCDHTESVCIKCESVMWHSSRYRICSNDECDHWIPKCLQCGGDMDLKVGPYSRFWGCENYSSVGVSCRHKESVIEVPESIIRSNL